MIVINGKEITSLFAENHALIYVYSGAKLVWSAIRSCFGSGYWVSNRPWNRTDGWRRK